MNHDLQYFQLIGSELVNSEQNDFMVWNLDPLFIMEYISDSGTVAITQN